MERLKEFKEYISWCESLGKKPSSGDLLTFYVREILPNKIKVQHSLTKEQEVRDTIHYMKTASQDVLDIDMIKKLNKKLEKLMEEF